MVHYWVIEEGTGMTVL